MTKEGQQVLLTGGGNSEYQFIAWTTKPGVMIVRDSAGNEFYASGSVTCAVMICRRNPAK